MQIVKWSGKAITRPGWYSHVPLAKYHSADICTGPAVSSSDLRICWSKSPAHFYANWSCNPKAEERRTTRAMILGAAAHHILLGEDAYKLKFISQPEFYRDRVTAVSKAWNNNANYCRAWHEAQAKAGKTVVTLDEFQTIIAMAKSLSLEPLVNDGLLRGHVELSGFWKDDETGIWCKVRPDVVPTASGDFVDLKTANDVTTPAIQSAIRSRGYHMQGSLCWEASEILLPDRPFQMFVLMFIETAVPYCARAVPLPDDDLARGRLQNRAMLRKIAQCISANHFPGPGEGDLRALPLSIDERERIDARLKFEGLT